MADILQSILQPIIVPLTPAGLGHGTGGNLSLVFAQDFRYGVSSVACVRATSGTHQRKDGTWQSFSANLPRQTDLGLLREAAATQIVQNPDFAGAVAPSTFPAGMTGPGGSGITVSIVGTGTEDGLPFMDVRIAGTASATAFPGVNFVSYQAGHPASVGHDYVGSVFARILPGGTVPANAELNVTVEGVSAANAAQSGDNSSQRVVSLLSAASVGKARLSTTRVITNAASVGTRFRMFWLVYSGSICDFTVRLAAPQLERGLRPTSPMLQTGARAADVLTVPLAGLGRAGALYADYTIMRRNDAATAEPLFQVDRTADAADNRHRIAQSTTAGSLTAVWRAGGSDIGTRTVVAAAGSNAKRAAMAWGIGRLAFAADDGDVGSAVASAAPFWRPDRLVLGSDHSGAGSNVLIRSVSIYKPEAAPERQVATNCAVPNAREQATTGNIVRETRTRHFVGRAGASSLTVRMAGYFVDGVTDVGRETDIGNACTYEAAIEITGAPTPVVRVTAEAVAVPSGSAETVLGSVAPSQFGLTYFEPGTAIWIRTRESVAVGEWRPTCQFGPSTGGSAITHDGGQDNLMSTGALVASGGATQVSGSLLRPLLVTGPAIEADIAVAIAGNSIDQGSSDDAGDGSNSGGGFWARGLHAATGGPIASCNMARGSTTVAQLVAFNDKRLSVMGYFNTLAHGDVTNDLAGVSGDQSSIAREYLQASLAEFRAAGIDRVLTRTTIPRTDAGNTAAISGFQTGGAERDPYNTWLAANFLPAGADVLVDANAAVRHATNLDLWASGNTGDGVHPNATGSAALATPATAAVNGIAVRY